MNRKMSKDITKYSNGKTSTTKTFDYILEQNGYQLGLTIGTGSYAKVKEGIDFTGKRIAAKIIDQRKAPSDFLNKFLPRELDICVKLNHPNIIKVYNILPISHRIYIFMELAQGGDLLDYIKKNGALQSSEAKRLFYELCQAIKYCHYLQITHRDLKCENILLHISSDGRNHVKLADFGFSRSCVDLETGKRILSRTYCGSSAYAAPEILQGNPYNPKLYDIWSLGCILYIMVCGYMPFDDSDIKKMIRDQIEGKLKYPSRFDHNKMSDVKELLNKMLEPDITRRYNIDKVLDHKWLRDMDYS